MNISLPDMISAVPSRDVTAMVKRINKALFDRATFERAKRPNSSHVELRRVAARFADSRTVAAFFCVVNADPDLMFNRVRKEGWRSNLKGFHKVRQLIDYVTGRSGNFETVSKALFACTILAALKGTPWIASPEQELMLSPERVNSLPPEIREAIREFQHKHMTIEGDARPQACQFRTTFSNLGLFHYMRDEFDSSEYTMGIMVNLESPVIQYLSNQWGLNNA